MGFGLSILLAFSLVMGAYCLATPLPVVLLGGNILIDKAGLYLSLISVVFLVCFLIVNHGSVGGFEASCLVVSLVSSVICFLSNNTILFWVSYEVCIIPLLMSLYTSSPYSERYLAGWYLITYVLLTSLPMFLVLVYGSLVSGTYLINSWLPGDVILNVMLFILFITKVPLPPFHSWLPVVHAEASTMVSVALSGYVMKLGIAGVYRFCSTSVEIAGLTIFCMFFFSLIFFMGSGSELDTKRWLAFLSLSHILVCVVGIYFLGDQELHLSLIYCLGHGLSAGFLFYYFSCLYGSSGTRNWVVISMLDGNSIFWRVVICLGLLTVASFPPSMSFVAEVMSLVPCISSSFVSFTFSVYLLVGGLIPVVLMGIMLCNVNSAGSSRANTGSNSTLLITLFIIWLVGGLLL